MRSLNRAFEEAGGAFFNAQPLKKGAEMISSFYISSPDKYTGRLFELLNEVVCKPLLSDNGFMPSYVHNACSAAAREISEKITDKRSYAEEKLIELMFDDEFAICGDGYIEDFGDITGSSLYSAYKSLLEGGVTELYITGNISCEEAESYIANHFDTVSQNTPHSCKIAAVSAKSPRLHTIAADTSQSVLTVGIRTSGADYPKLLVANEILGGSASSQLFNRVREKEGMCYYIGSRLYRYSGVISVQAGIEARNCDRVTGEVKRELDRLSRKGAEEKELNRAKQNIIARLVTVEDYPQRLTDLMLSFSVAGEPYSVKELIEAVSSVTQADVRSVFENAFIDTVLLLEEGKR
jgi:predicted Zn-dependent peptidase